MIPAHFLTEFYENPQQDPSSILTNTPKALLTRLQQNPPEVSKTVFIRILKKNQHFSKEILTGFWMNPKITFKKYPYQECWRTLTKISEELSTCSCENSEFDSKTLIKKIPQQNSKISQQPIINRISTNVVHQLA